MARIVSPRIVGRSEELARLLVILQRSQDTPHVVLVGGEAGIGKTRVVTEFVRLARQDGATVLSGECLAIGAGAVPNAPLAAMLRTLVVGTDDAVVEQVLGPARKDLAHIVPQLAMGGERARDPPTTSRLCELVLGVAARLSQHAPLVLVFEDLHWADASTRMLVGILARYLVSGPALVVATYRTDELHRRHPLLPLLAELERREQPTERLALPPLDASEIAELVRAISGTTPSGDELEPLVRLSQGNPFYLEELLAAPADTRISRDLNEVVTARLAAFTDRELRLLRLVAAAETAVAPATLALVAGEEPPEVADATRELIERHVLVRREGDVALRHALVREVLYDALIPGEREQVHREYARALSTTGSERIGEIAYHWWRAGDLVQALPAAIDAGRAARHAGAVAEAHACYERALAIWEGVDRPDDVAGLDHESLVRLAAGAAHDLRQFNRTEELVVRELSRSDLCDPRLTARLWLLLWAARWQSWESARDCLDRAVECARSPHATPARDEELVRTRLLADAAFGYAISGQGEQAAAILGEADLRSDDPATDARALNAHGEVLLMHQDTRAVDQLELALAVAKESGRAEVVGRAYDSLTWALLQFGRYAEALDTAERAIEHARAVGTYLVDGILAEIARNEVLYRSGRWDEALRNAEIVAGHAAYEPLKHPLVPAALHVRRGTDTVLTERLARQHDAALRFGEEHWVLSVTAVALVEQAARERRFELARYATARTLELLLPESLIRAAELVASAVGSEAERAALARLRRDSSGVSNCLDEATRIVTAVNTAVSRAGAQGRGRLALFVEQGEAELSRVAGASAPELWEALSERWHSTGEAYPGAYASFRAADALLIATGGRGRAVRDRAGALLDLAHSTALALRAQPLLEDVENLARRARLPIGQRDAAVPGEPAEAPSGIDALEALGLTRRELDVLRLVAEGRSNGEIGTALFVTTKTASTHVSNILRKLDAANRIEAAAIAHRLGVLPPTLTHDRHAATAST